MLILKKIKFESKIQQIPKLNIEIRFSWVLGLLSIHAKSTCFHQIPGIKQ